MKKYLSVIIAIIVAFIIPTTSYKGTVKAEEVTSQIIYSEYHNSDGSIYLVFEVPYFQISDDYQLVYQQALVSRMKIFCDLVTGDEELTIITDLNNADHTNLSLLMLQSDEYVAGVIIYPKAYLAKQSSDGNTVEYNETFFFKTQSYSKTLPITKNLRDNLIYISCLSKGENGFIVTYDQNAESREISFSYEYVTISGRITTNADNKEYDGSYFYHIFNNDYQTLEDYYENDSLPVINISYRYFNVGNWYLLAIIIVVVSVIISLIVLKCQRKKVNRS